MHELNIFQHGLEFIMSILHSLWIAMKRTHNVRQA